MCVWRWLKGKGSCLTYVVCWPPTRPNMPFQRRWKFIFHWRGRAWLTVWDRVKIPRYTHRLMHRKRVTCALHDSYFRLTTIRHVIPRTAEVTHPGGQLWGDIEWTIELLYNSVKTGSQWVLETRSWRQNAVERTTPSGEGPQASDWAVQENENDTRLCPEGQGRLQSLFSLQLPLTDKPFK